ncbi:MAG TPA: hypothetical protein DCX22_00920 [Dehalococcoidia bacterium]|nr:hypothetical protein [Dehalococcoidia bacterium]
MVVEAVVIDGLKEKGLGDVIIIVGDIISEDDIPSLREMGVKAVFGPGTPTSVITDQIKQGMAAKIQYSA